MKMRVSVCALLLGCGGNEVATEYPFRDARGIECVRTCTDDRCGNDCDTEPMPPGGCGEDDPCWTVADGPLDGTGPNVLGLCDSCCRQVGGGIEYTWVWEDCSPIVCETDADCAVGSRRCEGGYCVE